MSVGEPITACLAPSEVGSTFAEGGRGSAGSVPNVTVWFIDGSRLVHSTVSPTPTTIVPRPKRIRDAVWEPAPVVVTISPIPAATSPGVPRPSRGLLNQPTLLFLSLLIIVGLVVGKWLGYIKNMNHSGHVRVSQAYELEVPCRRELHSICRGNWVGYQYSRVYAGRTIKTGSIGCSAWTPDLHSPSGTEQCRPHLAGS